MTPVFLAVLWSFAWAAFWYHRGYHDSERREVRIMQELTRLQRP